MTTHAENTGRPGQPRAWSAPCWPGCGCSCPFGYGLYQLVIKIPALFG